MTEDPERYLGAIIARDILAPRLRVPRSPDAPLLVTVSRDHGALGEVIAARLGEALHLPVLDRVILERVAERVGVPVAGIEQPGEHFTSGIATLLHSLLCGRACDVAAYRNALVEVVRGVAHESALIVGYGAHLVLQDRSVFRLRVVGTPEVAATRLAAAGGCGFDEALAQVRDINAHRARAIHTVFHDEFRHVGLECAENFDLVVNTDHLGADGALAVIMEALRQAGFIEAA